MPDILVDEVRREKGYNIGSVGVQCETVLR